MGLDIHTLHVPDGSNPSLQDRIILGIQSGIANAAGGGAGAAVTTAVAMSLPASYAVLINPDQDATAYVTSKTASGFNVVLTPRLAANTLGAGTFDVVVVG